MSVKNKIKKVTGKVADAASNALEVVGEGLGHLVCALPVLGILYVLFTPLTNVPGAFSLDGATSNVRKNLIKSNTVLTERIENSGLQANNFTPNSIVLDKNGNKISGLFTYETLDRDGDKTTCLGKYSAVVDEEAKNQVISLAKKLDARAEDFVFEKGPHAKDSSLMIPFEESVIASNYKKVTKEFMTNYKTMIDSSTKYEITPIGELQFFNQACSKSGIGYCINISDIATNEDGSKARFYADYIGVDSKFYQTKVVVDTKDFDGEIKEQYTDYTFAQFMDGNVESYKQTEIEELNEIKENKTAINVLLNK